MAISATGRTVVWVTIMKYTARSPIEWVSIDNHLMLPNEQEALDYVNTKAQEWVNEGRKWARDKNDMFELCANNNRFFNYSHGKVSYDNLGFPADMAANNGLFQWMAVLDEESMKKFHEAHKDEHCTCDGGGSAGCTLHDPGAKKLVA